MALGDHHHGKSGVRVARRHHCAVTNKDFFTEYECSVVLGGHNGPTGSNQSFIVGDNAGVVATDTCNNHAYIAAKEVDWETFSTPELFALAYAEHFLKNYDFLPYAQVTVTQVPWQRITVDSTEHSHAFRPGSRSERWTATARIQRDGNVTITSGVEGLVLLKTTKSAFAGFHESKFRSLPDVKERMVASEVKADWQYKQRGMAVRQLPFTEIRAAAYKSLVSKFAGDPLVGTMAPSVQQTAYQMGEEVLRVSSDIARITLFLPNIHYIPAPSLQKTGLHKFENDVYLPTEKPFGTIQCTVERNQAKL